MQVNIIGEVRFRGFFSQEFLHQQGTPAMSLGGPRKKKNNK